MNCNFDEFSNNLTNNLYNLDSQDYNYQTNNIYLESFDNSHFNSEMIKEDDFHIMNIEKYQNCRTEEKTINVQNSSILPNFYSIEQIMDILENKLPNEVYNKLSEGKNFKESFEYRFMESLNRKRKREEEKQNKQNKSIYIIVKDNEEKLEKKKRGRKTLCRSKKEEHNKYSSDNIIKKIKSKLFDYLIQFMNKLLEKITINIKLSKLSYKYISTLSRENELKLLKKTLKEILSFDITGKFKYKKTDYNKEIINKIINSENIIYQKGSFDYYTLRFILNLTFVDWLDAFTGKNTFEQLAYKYDVDLTNINFNLLKDNFIGIDKLLLNLEKNIDDCRYFISFVFYLYNYERWFFQKITKGKKKEEKEDIKDNNMFNYI